MNISSDYNLAASVGRTPADAGGPTFGSWANTRGLGNLPLATKFLALLVVLMISTLQIGMSWSTHCSGGVDRVFSDLAASLPAQGVRFVGMVMGPQALARTTNGLVHSFAQEHSSTLARLRGTRKTVADLITSEQPDLLASHFAFYTIPILSELSKRPFVMHFHGPWARESKEEGSSHLAAFAKQRVERLVYRRADRAIVLSASFAKLLHEDYGVEEEKIRIVPGAVDLDRFRPACSRTEARERLGWPTERPILLSVRRLVKRMGLAHLIEAIPRIRKRVPDVLLCIGGSGPMRHMLESRVKCLDLTSHVRFVGFIPDEDLPLAYRAADISVVPSTSLEGFGLVAAESLAAGTPSMVTNVGGLPQVVQKLSSDLVFESGSVNDLANSLTAALRGELRLPSEGECREYAARSFSRKIMATNVAAVYRELIT